MGFVHKTLAHQPIKKKKMFLSPDWAASISLSPFFLLTTLCTIGDISHYLLSLTKVGPASLRPTGPRFCERVWCIYRIFSFLLSLSLSLSLSQRIYLSYKFAMMSVYTLYHKNNFNTKIWLFINFIHTFYNIYIYTIIIRVVNSNNKVMHVNILALFYCSNQQL